MEQIQDKLRKEIEKLLARFAMEEKQFLGMWNPKTGYYSLSPDGDHLLGKLEALTAQPRQETLEEYIEWCLGTPELEVFRNVLENRMDDYLSQSSSNQSKEEGGQE